MRERRTARRRGLPAAAAGASCWSSSRSWPLVVGAWFSCTRRSWPPGSSPWSARSTPRPPRSSAAAGLADHPPLIDVNTGAVATCGRAAALGGDGHREPAVARRRPHRRHRAHRRWPPSRRPHRRWSTAAAATPTTGATPAGATPSTTIPTTTTPSTTATTTPPVPATAPATASWALVDRTGRVLADVASPPAGLVHAGRSGGGRGGRGRCWRPTGRPGGGRLAAEGVRRPGHRGRRHGRWPGDPQAHVTGDRRTSGRRRNSAQKYEDVAAVLAGAPLATGDVIDVSVPGSPVVTGGVNGA